MKRVLLVVLLVLVLIITLFGVKRSQLAAAASAAHTAYWQSRTQQTLLPSDTPLRSQYASYIGYLEEVAFYRPFNGNNGFLFLNKNTSSTGEPEILSFRIRRSNASSGLSGGDTVSEMTLSKLNAGELVVVYFTYWGDAVFVAYPKPRDYEAPNLLH